MKQGRNRKSRRATSRPDGDPRREDQVSWHFPACRVGARQILCGMLPAAPCVRTYMLDPAKPNTSIRADTVTDARIDRHRSRPLLRRALKRRGKWRKYPASGRTKSLPRSDAAQTGRAPTETGPALVCNHLGQGRFTFQPFVSHGIAGFIRACKPLNGGCE